ncbi:MAG: fibronectin type III domain-containing protein, partial [Nitrospiraceae bacterium]|nr:fibronectin type III domain-containing protein [Nitrospiraceae bacterium]
MSILILLLSISACGKKGPLTLASYEKPGAPSLLSIRHRQDSVILSWSYPADKEKKIKGFLVLKSAGGEFERLGAAENSARTLTDSGVMEGTRYRYKVLAQGLTGVLSEASNTAAIIPGQAPMPPHGVSALPS